MSKYFQGLGIFKDYLPQVHQELFTQKEAEIEVRTWLKTRLKESENVKSALCKNLQIRDFPKDIIKAAKQYRLMWEVVCKIIATHERNKKPLSDELIEFKYFALEHSEKKPRPRGLNPFENLYRDYCLGTAIYLLKKFGYHPIMTNDECKSGAISACEIVRKVYRELAHISLSQDAIKKIWQKISKTNTDILDMQIFIHYYGESVSPNHHDVFGIFLSELLFVGKK